MCRIICASVLALATAASAVDYGTIERQRLTIAGENRKLVIFVPKGLRKGESLPLVVALPETTGDAYSEVGAWEQQSFEKRFAVMSVDITTGGKDGWLPTEGVQMARDMEAVEEGMKKTKAFVESLGGTIDEQATIITAFSGGTYCTIWMGLRRPDLFLGVCGRATFFHKETAAFGKLDSKPNLNQHIFLFNGEIDTTRSPRETQLALKLLKETGFRNVQFQMIPKLGHESGRQHCIDWFDGLLKKTAKGRSEARKIAKELVKVNEAIDKERAGAYGKLQKLADRERKAGFPAGAVAILTKVLDEATKAMKTAEDHEANYDFEAALTACKEIERKYSGLEIAKTARALAIKIKKSDAYLAAELLTRAKKLKENGHVDKAADLFEKIVKKYPNTPSASEAAHLLK